MTAGPGARARIATLIAVGPQERLAEAAGVLADVDQAGALRVILISTAPAAGDPAIASQPDVIAIAGLRPEYINNAIAGVRLSSLPSVVWWRGGSPDGLEGVAALADRVILDVDDPWALWERAAALADQTAFTDLRWAKLTRWRAAMAHFFDLPDVRERAASFSRLAITGSDRPLCGLFAGWLDSSLGWNGRIDARFAAAAAPLEDVVLGGADGELVLRLLPNGGCLDARARLAGQALAERVVSAGDSRLHAVMSEELRVRSRDLAFERAIHSRLLERAGGRT